MQLPTLSILFLLAQAAPAQIPMSPPGAVAVRSQLVGDFDGDGFPDLYCFGTGRDDVLFRNDGAARFAAATVEAGLTGQRSRAALLDDFDGDGRADLLLVAREGATRLFRNRGEGLFEDVSEANGLGVLPPITAASSLHLDGDGRLDLRLEGERGEPVLLHNQGQAGFAVLRLELTAPDALALDGVSVAAAAAEPVASTDETRTAIDRTGAPDAPKGTRVPLGVPRTVADETVTAPTGPTGPQEAAPPFCAPSLADRNGGCLEASSFPGLGDLFPLSSDFFIDAGSGYVGINTIGPLYPLQVDGGALFDNPGTSADWAAKGLKTLFEAGYLGVEGRAGFDGFSSANWDGLSAGVAGIDIGGSGYGVLGHGREAGVRGESSTAPSTSWGELGAFGIGLVAAGTGHAAELHGDLAVVDSREIDTLLAEPFTNAGVDLHLYNGPQFETVLLDSHASASGDPRLQLFNDAGDQRFDLTLASDGAEMTLQAADGTSSLFFDGTGGNDGGAIAVRNDVGQSTVVLRGDDGADDGKIEVIDRSSSGSIELDARVLPLNGGASIALRHPNGNLVGSLQTGFNSASTASLSLDEADNSSAFVMSGDTLTLYDSSGASTITFNRQTGAKNGVVGTQSYGRRLLYAVESPEVWFEDFGSARLVNGEVTVELDPIFLETVTIDDAHPLMVYLTPTSPGLPLWAEQGQRSFTVRAMPGGRGDGSFNWRVVAKRKGLENARLEPFEPSATGG